MRRGSGILLHITSLPSICGVGDLGPWAYKFADFLAETKQGFWQILPLNPTDPAYGNSPYHSSSAFAGNPLLISPELLMRDGLLGEADLQELPDFPEERVSYESVTDCKEKLFDRAYERFKVAENRDEYKRFCVETTHWLEDFALFITLKACFQGKPWSEWPLEIRNRDPKALQWWKKELYERIERVKFLQYCFFQQWCRLKNYCNQRGIHIIGDLPIYVDYDSVDVWTKPEMFKLNEEKQPSFVAGVPPDYFSQTGQLWGNPVYHWEVMKENGYAWWIQRMRHNLKLFDLLRLDHFRGYVAYWEVPTGEKTAINGRWVQAPAIDFFSTLLRHFPFLPIIAEDLGLITPDVREIMQRFGFPGMRVLLFAFGEGLPMNPYAPHNHIKECVIYTGTHDNNTVRGWFEKEATAEEKQRLFCYLGREITVEEVNREFIRLAMMSIANLAIIPLQDILGLGEEARMNLPATKENNWQWRLSTEALTPAVVDMLRKATEIYGRA